MTEHPLDRVGKGRIGRRTVLKGMAGAAAVALFARGANAAEGKEAPEFAKLAADGKLPKLADRLPANPLVVETREKIGSYGGMWRRGLSGSSDHNGILRCVGNMGLTRWDFDFTKVLPNVAESWDVSDEFDHIRLPPAQGDEMVGRQALHRGRRGVLDRGLRQEHRALQVAAGAPLDQRQGARTSPRSTTARYSSNSPDRTASSSSSSPRRSASTRRCSASTMRASSCPNTTTSLPTW